MQSDAPGDIVCGFIVLRLMFRYATTGSRPFGYRRFSPRQLGTGTV